MSTFDLICWWIGYGLILGRGTLVGSMLLCLIVFFAVNLIDQKLRHLYGALTFFRDVQNWVAAGRPKWKRGEDNCYRMIPTDGEEKNNG